MYFYLEIFNAKLLLLHSIFSYLFSYFSQKYYLWNLIYINESGDIYSRIMYTKWPIMNDK